MASVSILPPIAPEVNELVERKLDQTRLNGFIPALIVCQTTPLLTLPAEIHIQIATFLSIGDQISASQTCTHWRNILLHSKYLRTTRYPSKLNGEAGPYTHKILSVHNFENVGFSDTVDPLNGLMCLVRGNSIHGYYYLRDEGKCESNYDDINIFDISKLSLLDEPLFSPAVFGSMGLALREVGGCKEASVNSYNLRLYVKSRSYTYRTRWSKHFNLDETTSVRKVVSTIVDEASAELTEWDICSAQDGTSHGEDHGKWIRVFLIKNPPEREEVAVCITSSPFYSII
ncbi:hypothetical protein H072_8677 [Dactylellina haptotyla CBS 200.50]|uniref:F-box domain-containing protein n=1 Tax=Dactylellina haptotyla (strain CBS 200.50) TaxID=1284197 RepID=S8BQX6_DACHA|nr:hypothetical protein H072_8677 [Dactylellina haptotyla CBS 200.50]